MNKQKRNTILNSNPTNIEKLQSLEELVTALSEGERTTYNHIMHSIKFPENAFDEHSSWSDECYTRNCIVDTEKFELILICWCEGHQTAIHDHGGEECWVKVLEGEFKETIYKQDDTGELKLVKTSISVANQVTYMKDFMGFHRLKNISKKRSMSLHLYAKPIRTCRMFEETLKTFIPKELSYDTISK
jgi:cysteine dioxygenase